MASKAKRKVVLMPKKKKETLVHFDIDTLSKQTDQKNVAHTISLGETLRSKREKKKLSIEDVANKLRIKEVYLKALEDGHYYAFPSRVYGIGFLRSYSKFLGLDSDLMVAEFHAETTNIKDAPLDMPVIEKHFALPSKKTLIILAFIILLIVISWFTVAFLLTTNLSSKLPEPELVNETEAEMSLPTEAPLLADETAVIEASEEQISPEPVKETTSAVTEEKKIDDKALKAEVALIAKNDVWVRLYNTDTQKVILDKVLRKNDSFIPESKLNVLEVSTGRGNALVLYKNGEKVKTFGEEKSRSLAEFAD